MNSNKLMLFLKGFSMGVADIVPGVSGGTIAFVTGIYDELLKSISSVDKNFIRLLLGLKIKEALLYINISFLAPLLFGIGVAIISTSRLMHFLINEYPEPTWSLFFGLIGASIVYLLKTVGRPSALNHFAFLFIGALVGYLLVSLIPVQTPENYLMIFFSGAVAICAMILPGISGSFILLIIGKYAFITGTLKQPFFENNLFILMTFCLGCLTGLLSFSKILNWLLEHYHKIMMYFLIGFMIGSLKKIWPWKEVTESIVIWGKTHVLAENNIIPQQFDGQFLFAVALMVTSFILVFILEKLSKKS